MGVHGRGVFPRVTLLAAVFLGYSALATTIASVSAFSANAAAVASFWPGAGLSLAALLLSPRRHWPVLLTAVFVAETMVNLAHDRDVLTSLLWGTANVVEPLIGATLWDRLTRRGTDDPTPPAANGVATLSAGGRRSDYLDTRRQVLQFVVAAAVVAPAAAAVIGASAPGLSDQAWAVEWLRWWIGDGIGVLLVCPLLLRAASAWAGRTTWRRRREDATASHPLRRGWRLGDIALGLTVLGVVAIFSPLVPVDTGRTVAVVAAPLAGFLAGSRRGVPTTLALLTVALAAEAGTALGHGPYIAGGETFVGLLGTQVFLAAMMLTMLITAAVTEELRVRDERSGDLERAAFHDPLTGLPNRRLLTEFMNMRATQQAGCALMVVDLDNFKHINDSLGHPAGDEVLCETARRLCELVRAHDLVVRTGGDEFLVVVNVTSSDAPSEEALAVLSDRIRTRIREPMDVAGHRLTITASVGTATSWASSTPLHDLLATADTAMYASKKLERSGEAGAGAPGSPTP